MSLAVLLLLVPAAVGSADLVDVTPRIAVVELEGPGEGAVLECDGARSRVELALASGETRSVRVPFSGVLAESRTVPAAVEATGADPSRLSVRFVQWERSLSAERWNRLSPGLRARPFPALERARARPKPAAWVVLAAAGVLGVLARRRRTVLVAVGGGAALLLGLLPLVERIGTSAAIVLEGETRAPRWLEVELRDGSAEVDLDRLLRLALLPAGAEPEWIVAGSPRPRVLSAAPGARFALYREAEPLPLGGQSGGGEALAPGATPQATWVRTPRGAWTAHGPWRPGSGLGAPVAGADPPPGWLAAGLPPGVGVLLGRLPERAGVPTWLRLTGFSRE